MLSYYHNSVKYLWLYGMISLSLSKCHTLGWTLGEHGLSWWLIWKKRYPVKCYFLLLMVFCLVFLCVFSHSNHCMSLFVSGLSNTTEIPLGQNNTHGHHISNVRPSLCAALLFYSEHRFKWFCKLFQDEPGLDSFQSSRQRYHSAWRKIRFLFPGGTKFISI